MAQVLAVPGHVRHGFSYIGQFNHDFGRITGIAATIKGNVLFCDYDKKNLILVDALGNYLKKLDIDSEPYDVTITSQNIGFITQPNSRTILQVDPDRMVLLFKSTCIELNTSVLCVSALSITGISNLNLCVNSDGCLYAGDVNYEQISSSITHISKHGCKIGSPVVKFYTVNNTYLSCIGGQNDIQYNDIGRKNIQGKIPNIATMDTPSDICSDDYEHIYVSGQGSNNIHRLTDALTELKKTNKRAQYLHTRSERDWKVLDIPLSSSNGIKEPVAICFNQDYSKLYVVNEWGKSVLIFDVI